jgi:hypothetical protein
MTFIGPKDSFQELTEFRSSRLLPAQHLVKSDEVKFIGVLCTL